MRVYPCVHAHECTCYWACGSQSPVSIRVGCLLVESLTSKVMPFFWCHGVNRRCPRYLNTHFQEEVLLPMKYPRTCRRWHHVGGCQELGGRLWIWYLGPRLFFLCLAFHQYVRDRGDSALQPCHLGVTCHRSSASVMDCTLKLWIMRHTSPVPNPKGCCF